MNKYPPLKGKCKEYIEKGICLGCNKLEDVLFTGDDSCSYIKKIEKQQHNYQNWRIR